MQTDVKPEFERHYDFANLKDMTVLRSWDDINFVLRSQDSITLKGDEPEASRPFTDGVLLSKNGDEHLARRRLYSRLFSNEMLQYFYDYHSSPAILDELRDLHQASVAQGVRPEANLAVMGPALLYRVAAQVVGIDLGALGTSTSVIEFTKMVESYGNGISIEFSEDADAHEEQALRARAELRSKFYEPSRERRADLVDRYERGEIEKDDLPRDIVTLWLLDEDRKDEEELLFREVFFFLHAGTRTTMRILTHCVDEITAWRDAHPEKSVDVTSSQFLRGAISETMRVHGLIPALLRKAVARLELPSGTVIEEGERLALDFQQANFDPDVFGADADEFDPFRIDRLDRRTSPWGLSFGGGAHACIGRRLVTGGDWRRGTRAKDQDIDGSLVAVTRALFAAGVRPVPESAVHNREAVATQFDEYVTYPVMFTNLDEFVQSQSQTLDTGEEE